MKKYLLVAIVLIYSCNDKKEGSEELRLIPAGEVIERANANDLDYSYAIFKGARGTFTT